jgi:hypothetical protein
MNQDVGTTVREHDDAGWALLAAGAIAVGVVGAVIGCARSCRSREDAWTAHRADRDTVHVTPPHGDVLHVRDEPS